MYYENLKLIVKVKKSTSEFSREKKQEMRPSPGAT